MVPDDQVHCPGERPVRGSQPYRHIAGGLIVEQGAVRHDQVVQSVVVQVGDDDPVGVAAGREVGRWIECAVSMAPQKSDVVLVHIGQCQIGMSVPIEVPPSDSARRYPRWEDLVREQGLGPQGAHGQGDGRDHDG